MTKFELFFGHDLLALVPISDKGDLDVSKLGGFAFMGYMWNKFLTDFIPHFMNWAAVVPIQATFVLWCADMLSGLLKSYYCVEVPQEASYIGPKVYVKRVKGQPWWDGDKARLGLHRLVWLWTPVIVITYTLRTSHLSGMPQVASLFEIYVVTALALSAISNLAVASGSKGLQSMAQKGLNKIEPEGK